MEKPKSVGPYALERELGRGNYGAVYLARHQDLQRPVALKVLLVTGDPTVTARFEREARVASRLSHPAIVGCFDVGQDPRRRARYLAMDYVEGETLKERLKRGPLDVREAQRIGCAIASALTHAHGQDVVHRDLKPDNVLLDAQGLPHVTDFGLARDLSDDVGQLTADGMMVGTPDYMAPEQTTGEPVDARVDVYALGAILYQCLTGQKPFQGSDLAKLIHRIRQGKPERPAKLRPEIPFAFEDVVLRAMARDPRYRFQTAAALQEALEELELRSLSASAVLWAKSHARPLVITGVIGAVVAAGIGIGLALGGGPRPDAATAPTPPVVAPSTPASPEPSRSTPAPDLAALDDARLEAYLDAHPDQPEPYLVLIRRKIDAWSFGAAEAWIPKARDRAPGPEVEGALPDLRQRIKRGRAAERDAARAIRRRYQQLDPLGALELAKRRVRERSGSLALRRLLVHMQGVCGDWIGGRDELAALLALAGADDRDRETAKVYEELARVARPGGEPKGWLPIDGGHWTLDDGVLHGSQPGLGEFNFCGRLNEKAGRVEPPRTVSVEMKFKPDQEDSFAGLMFAVESPGTMFIAYPFQNAGELKRLRRMTGQAWEQGFRLALLRRGRWAHIETLPVKFRQGWFTLALELSEDAVVPVLDGVRLRKIRLPHAPRGRVGVMKFYGTTASFRNLRTQG